MPKAFSKETLEKFEAAAASIPLRQLVRAFEAAAIRPGKDPGGPDGARKEQFRRYIAGVDQQDPQQLDRLGDALGALIAEVATSKEAFLITAAERDGFAFTDSAFRPAITSPSAFAVTRLEDLGSIEERARRLYLLTSEDPTAAIAGAKELVESACRIVLRSAGKPAPGKAADLVAIVDATIKAVGPVATRGIDAKSGANVVLACLQQLGDVVARLDGVRSLSARDARLAVGAAVAFAAFLGDSKTAAAFLHS